MKKNLKQILATTFAGLLAFATLGASVPTIVNAAEESTEPYRIFVAFGGDVAEENDWGLAYAGGDASEGITVTDGEIAVGETVKIGLEFANPVVNAWYFAPTMIAENVVDASFDVKVFIDGQEVAADLSAGDNWWYEETGDFDKTKAVRIAGGFNEWGTQYIAEPSNFTKIEFEITANSIQVGEAVVGDAVESTESYDMYLAFGGDAAEENDWGLNYAGGEASEGITATDAKIAVGETASVKLEFANPVVNAWYFAPFIVAENVVDASFDVKVLVDGQEVDVDMSAGDNWWYEATGDFDDKHAVRIAGGFNEWGAQYIAEPSGFTSLEFVVTANSIKVGTPAEEAKPVSAAGDVDLDCATPYHAYIGIQTPKFSFRNSYSDSQYGFGTTEFSQVTGWDADSNEVVLPGTFEDVEINGNGTYTVKVTGLEFPDGEFAEQEYMNLIFLSTDIPNTGAITISDIKLSIDGSEVSGIAPILNEENVDYVDMQIQNIWNDTIKTIGYYPVPMSEIAITFTVSGFNVEGSSAPADVEIGTDEQASQMRTGLSTPAIIGIVVGAVVLIAIIVVVVILVTKKGKKD